VQHRTVDRANYLVVDMREDAAGTAGALDDVFCSSAVCARWLRFSAFTAACGNAPAAARGTGGLESARATNDPAAIVAAVKVAIIVPSFISRLPSFR
jgi:hypothetical protein